MTSPTKALRWAFVAAAASLALGLVAFPQSRTATPQPPTKSQLEFFEGRIRPIFAENCYKCHSGTTGAPKAGLELDWKGGWEKGGNYGPSIIPGDPEKSILIQAVRYSDNDLQMPPTGKLSADQINDLVSWVKMGAPDPRTSRPAAADAVAYGGGNKKEHWAFKPVANPKPPVVKQTAWVKNDIDRFVLLGVAAIWMRGESHAAQIRYDHGVISHQLSRDRRPHVPAVAETVQHDDSGSGSADADV